MGGRRPRRRRHVTKRSFAQVGRGVVSAIIFTLYGKLHMTELREWVTSPASSTPTSSELREQQRLLCEAVEERLVSGISYRTRFNAG